MFAMEIFCDTLFISIFSSVLLMYLFLCEQLWVQSSIA